MPRKRIDPKLPIAPTAGDDPAVPLMKPDRFMDRLVRRLNELFLEQSGSGVEILDEGVDLGFADTLNFVGANVTATLSNTTGTIDISFSGGTGGGDTITATASEAIAAGQFVALFDSSGTPKCRVAKSSSGQGFQADGFCKDAFALGATATISLPGAVNVAGGTGLTAGDVWLGTDGYATNTAPTTTGYISQQIGVAEDGTKVAFEPQPDILLADVASSTTAAPADASYVVMSANSVLTQERVLTAGAGITVTDGGANSTVTISATQNSIGNAGWFGDGSDGALHFDGASAVTGSSRSGSTYTLSRCLFAASILIDSGVTVLANGWAVFCLGTTTNNGTLGCPGLDAPSSPANASGGQVGGNWYGIGTGGGTGAAGSGNPGSPSGALANALGGTGGAGGTDGAQAGGAAGVATVPTNANGGTPFASYHYQMVVGNNKAGTQYNGGTGGGGGGSASPHVLGGGGGGGGGIFGLFSYAIAGSGTLTCAGGSPQMSLGNSGAGGGGGGGGCLFVITTTANWNSLQTVNVAGGPAGPGSVVGSAGGAGRMFDMIL